MDAEIYNLRTVEQRPYQSYEMLVKGRADIPNATLFLLGPGARPGHRARFVTPHGNRMERDFANRLVAFGWLVTMAERHL